MCKNLVSTYVLLSEILYSHLSIVENPQHTLNITKLWKLVILVILLLNIYVHYQHYQNFKACEIGDIVINNM